jgi:hypothetical protein
MIFPNTAFDLGVYNKDTWLALCVGPKQHFDIMEFEESGVHGLS